MSKKITIELSDKSEQYFWLVKAGLDYPQGPDGKQMPNNSDVINYCLESLADFEKTTDDQLVNWLEEKYSLYSKRQSEREAEKEKFIEKHLELIEGLNNNV